VDLSGEYWFGSLSADATSNVPWGKRGTVVVTGDNWSQEWDDQDGHHTFTSTYTTSFKTDGSLNIILSSGTYNVAWNGDVMIHADTAPDAHNRLGVDIITRKAENVNLNDAIGDYTFFGHQSNSIERNDSAEWGNIVFKTNGTAAYKHTNDHGLTESGTLNWTLDNINSMLNIQGQTSQNGLLLGKDGIELAFQVLPSEGVDDDLGYNVFIKKTTQTIAPADLAGTYQVRFLETGPGGVPYTCGQGTIIIREDRTFSIDAYYSDTKHDVKDGTYTVGPGNKIRISGAAEGIVSPDKGLIFVPEYDRPKNPADYDWIGGIFLVRTPNTTPVFQFGSIPGAKKKNLTITDAGGVLVMFSLTGGGYGEITDAANFDEVVLYDTGDKSQLTISTKGKTYTSIGSIICNGSMKGISAKTAKLSGSITIGSSSNPKSAVTIVFDRSDNLAINSQMPIKSISATEWLGGSINAPSVGSIAIKGDKKRIMAGDLYVDVEVDGGIGGVTVAGELSGSWNCNTVKSIKTLDLDTFNLYLNQGPDDAGKILALGTLAVKGQINKCRISSNGNIGTVTAGKMVNTSCFAGVADACLVDVDAADDVLDLPPVLGDTFNETATIKSIAIKGIKGVNSPYFVNSNIAAANILSVSIAYPQYDNSDTPFGISMWNNPTKTLKIKDDEGTHSWKGIDIGDAIDWLTDQGYDMEIRRD
jgi:hypothetical protein